MANSKFFAAFRHVPIRVQDFKWLVMKAEHPITGEVYYFVDKALPFGSSRSDPNLIKAIK